ncbi:MAG TPA: hypothetical protein ENI13_01270 [candidate division CPR3 bacterium]|uniref:Uncharacterized protein n=1 Tax=candidate division CPR3 bacterium TaxID=2268181 RepID=A0A7C1NJS0_UNCC3|nr:hypothetical protein [candidate division CPR3 bacterium]
MVQWLNNNQGFVMSLLTACYVFFTLWIILGNRKERRTHLDRELVNRICNPLIGDFKRTKLYIEDFRISDLPWKWESLKNKERYLSYRLPKRIFDGLEDFTSKLRRHQNLYRGLQGRLLETIEKEEKKKVPQLGSEGVWSVHFDGRIGGESCKITLLQLLFWNETFDQYKERLIRDNPILPNRKIDGDFMVPNTSTKLNKRDFEEINTSIKRAIGEDRELQQLINEGGTLYENAEVVENTLNKFVKRTLKKIS